MIEEHMTMYAICTDQKYRDSYRYRTHKSNHSIVYEYEYIIIVLLQKLCLYLSFAQSEIRLQM